NVAFNAISDRSTATLYVSRFQVRAVDGTGVTDTETVGDGVAADTGSRSFTYGGLADGKIVSSYGAANPLVGVIQIDTAVPTNKVLLAVYSLKSQNVTGTLTDLKLGVSISGNGNTDGTLTNMFNSIYMTIGSTTVNGAIGTVSGTAGGYQSATVDFQNLSIPLPADAYTDVSVYGDIAADTSSRFEGMLASTTLDLSNSANITVDDPTFTAISPLSATLTSNDQEFTESGISLGGLPSVTYGDLTESSNLNNALQQFTFTIPLMAGKNAIYIPNSEYLAFATTTTPTGMSIVPVQFTDDNTNGDGSTYFYIAPGQVKTITAIFNATGTPSTGGIFKLQEIVYGTTPSSFTKVMASPDVTKILTAVLFH
ncbi:MAG: hypothetical protein KGI45_03855, partial [Patescibacteria group bacterium]|nr:hypothetical protein [Patescibacteria group bacterium]